MYFEGYSSIRPQDFPFSPGGVKVLNNPVDDMSIFLVFFFRSFFLVLVICRWRFCSVSLVVFAKIDVRMNVVFCYLSVCSSLLGRWLTSAEDYFLCVDNVEVDPRWAWCCYWYVICVGVQSRVTVFSLGTE